MNKGEWGKLRAFFDLETEDGFVVKGFKLVQGINGLFVGFPSQKGNDDEYHDTVYADKDIRDELNQMAIDYYGQNRPEDENLSKEETSDSTDNIISTGELSAKDITDEDIPF
tara:strand:+ start:36 stop:371 length:336 start_codon:yes stop_codon:yes gene_type:complete